MANEINPAADFQALPLEFIISNPLIGAIKAQSMAAQATREFIESFLEKGTDGVTRPVYVEFDTNVQDSTDAQNPINRSVHVKAPLLAMLPIPHLRIDSITTNFKYEISQVVKDSKSLDMGLDMSANTGALLSPWVSATLKGSVASKSAEESTMNRSGTLDITVHASESPIPEGLALVLNFLTKSINVSASGAQAQAQNQIANPAAIDPAKKNAAGGTDI